MIRPERNIWVVKPLNVRLFEASHSVVSAQLRQSASVFLDQLSAQSLSFPKAL
ncbi:hypothetical protein BMETH_446_0 [methanotrophic bacterial endosymbiont of Bathymodiolus sp.]|nr:hypothetical protein BMETH_446_0 [methanotrophic bacterial endosymbiont of Bathymodiolus sp.]